MNVYILELNKSKKYYIIKTDNIEDSIKKYKNYNIEFIKDNQGINKYTKSELNIDINLKEKYEIITNMIKYGYNNVRGDFIEYLNMENYLKIKKEITEDKNLEDLCYKINNNWIIELDNKILQEKQKIENTVCFNCGRKGHYAGKCIEKYNIDGIYIENYINNLKQKNIYYSKR